jgi:hypothetical protein
MLMRTDPFRECIPVAEKAKPRKISITATDAGRREINA